MLLFYQLLGLLILLHADGTRGDEREVIEGQKVVLPCGLEGYERVRWTKDGLPVKESSRVYLKNTDLVVARVDRVLDQGSYSCAMSTRSSAPVFLNISWLSDDVLVKVKGKLPTASGENLHLTCIVEGSEPMSIQWFRNGDGLKTNGKITVEDKDLTVVNVNPLDNGVYRCVATNQATSKYSSNTVVPNVPGDQWAYIEEWPRDQLVTLGSDAYFNCVYKFADVIEWYFKQTGPLENTTHYSVFPNGTLVIHDVTKRDEGLYSCVGIRGESTEVPQLFTAHLNIAYLSSLREDSLEPEGGLVRMVAQGSGIEVLCLAPSGLPPPSVAWAGPGATPGPVLTLRSVTRSANYTCTASNSAGQSLVSLHIVVTKPPQIIQDPIAVIANEGEEAVFTCNFLGNAKYSEVIWMKDNIPIKANAKKGVLKLMAVEPGDRGLYSCQVLTPPHPAVNSRPAALNIIEKLKFSPRPVNKVLELDEVKKIHCKAQGATPPNIKWAKEGSEELPDHVTDSNGTLQFNPVKVEDKGKYTCTASNPQGTINATIHIDVVVSPRFVILPKNPTYATEGFPVIMDCIAEGDPKPAIHWDKNSLMNNFDERFQILDNGSLMIEMASVSDEGKYGCTAGNSGGLKRFEASLIVRGVEGYRVSEGMDQESMMSKTVGITLGAAGAYMMLVIGLMAYCRCRNQRKKSIAEQPDSLCQMEAGHSGENKRCNGDAKQSDGELTANSHCSNNSRSNYGKMLVTRDQLSNMMLLGKGIFGDVCLAQIKSFPEGENVVMVKALQETRDEDILQDFKRELDLFSRVDHCNVVKLIGLCREADPHYMVLQYTDWGDLKQMLLATKKERKDRPKPPEMTEQVMLSLCHQLALGMENISNRRLVHRDLAARNCLITSDLKVKISLSALCKDTYSKEYATYRNKLIAVRWQPFEVVSEDDYSTKSDVYSFGATAWEIFCGGALPMGGLSDSEVVAALEAGRPPWQLPSSAHQALRPLLDQCWSTSPTLRPTFSHIALTISELLEKHS